MATRIKLKTSTVADKVPVQADLEIGEIGLNANAASVAAYIKDTDNNIVQIAGQGALDTPTLQAVCDEGSTTTTGITAAGNITAASGGTFTGASGILLRTDTNQIFVNGTADGSAALDVGGKASIKGDGSITAAGNGIFGGDADNGGAAGVRLASAGAIAACRTSGSTAVFSGYTQGNSTPQISISAGGSITAAGDITADGVATAKGLTLKPSSSSGGIYIEDKNNPGTFPVTILESGSITADGQITSGDASGGASTRGVSMSNTGTVFIGQSNGGARSFSIYDTTNSDYAVSMFGDGRITATGQVQIGNDISTASGVRIYSSGAVYARYDTPDSGSAVWKSYNGGLGDSDLRSAVYSDGSAYYSGSIEAAGSLEVNTGSGNTGHTTPILQGGNGGGSFRSALYPDGSLALGGSGTFSTNSILLNGSDGNITTAGKVTANLFSGSLPYSDLTGAPTIPTNNNQLTNGAGYITAAEVPPGVTNNNQLINGAGYYKSGDNPSFATVTATGYNLSSLPSLP